MKKVEGLIILSLVILFVLILSPIVSATVFYEDTDIKQGQITYVFVGGLELDSFDLFSGGIKLDGQPLRISLQGGELKVFIYEWNGIDDHKIGLLSSVPQSLDFAVRNNGVDYYFYDGVSYSIDSYDIGLDLVNGSFRTFEDVKEIVVYSDIEAVPWYRKNIFEFEVNSRLEDGVVYGRVVGMSYLTITLIIIFLIIIMFFVRRFA